MVIGSGPAAMIAEGGIDLRMSRIDLPPCCSDADASRLPLPPWWGGDPADDPYVTLYMGQSTIETSSRLVYSAPSRVGRPQLTALRAYQPPAPLTTSSDLLEKVALSRGLDPKANVSLAGSGGFSDAFFVHPRVPDDLLREWEAEAKLLGKSSLADTWREAWVRANATEVVKIRRPDLDGQKVGLLLLRDYAVQEVAVDLAARARYDGGPLVRVAAWKSTPEELSRGVIRQEVIRGPSVKELEKAAQTVESYSTLSPGTEGERAALEKARRLLAEAGLSSAEARDRVAALEEFYRRSHNALSAFQDENRLARYGNRIEDRRTVIVGLDYNHGNNVAWDKDTQQFVMFDW